MRHPFSRGPTRIRTSSIHTKTPIDKFWDKVVDMPDAELRQLATVQNVQKSVKLPQLRFIDNVINIPGLAEEQIHRVQMMQNKRRNPQVQHMV